MMRILLLLLLLATPAWAKTAYQATITPTEITALPVLDQKIARQFFGFYGFHTDGRPKPRHEVDVRDITPEGIAFISQSQNELRRARMEIAFDKNARKFIVTFDEKSNSLIKKLPARFQSLITARRKTIPWPAR